ncbi:ATP-binding protein [Paenibacillus puerhi]|uniref:ATP-binding protein n=1 Tax=Paenibacillus puerhi TaxID=2692622 RepID=UPI001F42DF51|nr:ATP-binding protein [Paenibacillus puerhi]
MMTKKKLWIAIALFFLLLTLLRVVWIYFHTIPEHPRAVQGQLDLKGWEFESQRTITLDGDWEFYPHTFLTPGRASDPDAAGRKGFLKVPGKWGSAMSPSEPTMLGYGSYRLLIKVDPKPGQAFGLRISKLPSSAALYINGKLRMQSGQPSAEPEQYTPRNVPFSSLFTADGDEIEVIIQAANYDNERTGGIIQSIKFGSASMLDKEETFSRNMQLIVVVVFIMHAVYAALLFGLGVRQKALLTLSLLVLSATLMVLLDDDKLLLVWLPISFGWGVKLFYLSATLVPGLMFKFIADLLPGYEKQKHFKYVMAGYALVALSALCLPLAILLKYFWIANLLLWITFLLFPWIFMRMLTKGEPDTIYLMLGATAVANSSLWGIIKTNAMPEINFYPLDLLFCFLAFAAFWFKRYIRTANETEKLAGELQQASKQKDDFLANTSHELRNPLHGIINIAQTVLERERPTMGQKSSADMDLLISIGRRMSFLLNDLLDLTRLQEQGIRLQRGSISIQAVASGVIDLLRFMTEGKPVRFVLNIPEEFPPVHADENRLVQIMFNLLHNAVKFTAEGSITVEAEQLGESVRIRVIDTGVGMDEATRQRIFQPYEQGDSGITALSGGIGLGLSICKQLLELHESTIEVASAPGEGSVFSFTLPVAPSSMTGGRAGSSSFAAAARSLPPPAENSRVTGSVEAVIAEKPIVLAIDDDPINLNILKEILTEEAYRITTARSAVEALGILESQDWDLIISDIMMPQMSGYELARIVRERFSLSELPVLLLTARSRPEDMEAGFLSGANDYVTKPMDAMELKARVQALTAMKISAREHLRMEAAFLQAQIQPHFLFNTLNSIAALSEIDTARMRNLLAEFGHYLRASFDSRNSERLVPLEHELQLVRSYLFIEKERFEERLEVLWEVDESIQLQLPPLSIQPLVENAVKHGVLARAQGGMIGIRITEGDRYAEITVSDNGVGIEETQLSRLLLPENRTSGIGLRNTDRRLKQLYGTGLHIESKQGHGTTVKFTVFKSHPGSLL